MILIFAVITFLLLWTVRGLNEKVGFGEIKIESSETSGDSVKLNDVKAESRDGIIAFNVDFVPRKKRSKSSNERKRLNQAPNVERGSSTGKGREAIKRECQETPGSEFSGYAKMENAEEGESDISREEDTSSAILGNYCSTCRIQFRYNQEFDKHSKNEHGIAKPYSCVICEGSYTVRCNLLKHMRNIHDLPRGKKYARKPVHCEICKIDVRGGWKAFQEHAGKQHVGIKMMRCSRCPMTYHRRNTLLSHERKAHRVVEMARNLKCEFCKNTFGRSDELTEHAGLCERRQMKKRTGIIVLNRVKMNGKDAWCNECRAIFKTADLLKNHYRTAHPNVKMHSCHFCDKAFRGRPFLERHLDMQHADADADMKSFNYHGRRYRRGKIYECRYCDNKFVTLRRYEEHGKLHPGQVMFYCEECGKGYHYRRTLWNHANEDHGDANLKQICKYCTKCYFNGHRFRRHETYCKRKTELRAKMKREGTNGHYCEICRKIYYFSPLSFGRHMKRHKRYDFCTLCDRCFDRVLYPTALTNHAKLRHPVVNTKIEMEPLVEEFRENVAVLVKREIKEETEYDGSFSMFIQ